MKKPRGSFCDEKPRGLNRIHTMHLNSTTHPNQADVPAITDQQKRERARRYLAKIPGAIAGGNPSGLSQTFEAARCLIWGFALNVEQALELLMTEYNNRCEPPWT